MTSFFPKHENKLVGWHLMHTSRFKHSGIKQLEINIPIIPISWDTREKKAFDLFFPIRALLLWISSHVLVELRMKPNRFEHREAENNIFCLFSTLSHTCFMCFLIHMCKSRWIGITVCVGKVCSAVRFCFKNQKHSVVLRLRKK